MNKDSKTNQNNGMNTEIRKLIADLSSKNMDVRTSARSTLISIGQPAIIPLLEQLQNRDQWIRWEAAKVLAEMREPSTIPMLVESLTNKDPSIRWLASEGLIALGSRSLGPILEVLANSSDSHWFDEGAHHVLHDLSSGMVHEGENKYIPLFPLTNEMKSIIKPVLESLDNLESSILTQEYAKIALHELKKIDASAEIDSFKPE